MVHHRKNQGHRDTASQVEPGTHDQKRPHSAPGTGHRTRSTGSTKERAQKNKTSNPKHDFKGCPKTRPAVQTGPGAWCVVGMGRGGCWTMTGPSI